MTTPCLQPLGRVAGPAGPERLGLRVLAVRGRKTNEWRTTPVNPLTLDGARYLVAPRGTTQWVRNIRVAGVAELRKGRRRRADPGHRAVRRREGAGPARLSQALEVRNREVLRGDRARRQRRPSCGPSRRTTRPSGSWAEPATRPARHCPAVSRYSTCGASAVARGAAGARSRRPGRGSCPTRSMTARDRRLPSVGERDDLVQPVRRRTPVGATPGPPRWPVPSPRPGRARRHPISTPA